MLPGSAAADDATLERYAAGTWASFEAMTDAATGLPTDQLLADGTRVPQTSTTNIGAYMWSAVAAERLGLIGRRELVTRLDRTLTTLERMERYGDTGQFYNWYDHRTGAKLEVWPPSGEKLTPILSSVDNAWLAVGLRIVRNAVPQLAGRAGALYDGMDFGFYYRPDENRILFHYAPSTGDAPCCYDTIVSESRIAYYVGIEKGDLPSSVYYGPWRTFPDTCAFDGQETRPSGFTRTYEGRSVYEGTYPYNATRAVPSWSGSMFEALMPTLFVPEEEWGPGSWAANHPLTVDAQIDHGLNVAGYGTWGFSFANNPAGGYRGYGVDALGMDAGGAAVQQRRHAGRPRLRPSGLPAAGHPGSAAERVHARRGVATRDVPRVALPAARDHAPRSPSSSPPRGPASGSTTRSTSRPTSRRRRTSRSTRG